ncbi:unnamed protein product [Blepharisma stoltei]|uniref:3-hydroxyacyl-CoA dehydrogenase n=1 Tax=Blepharisma stoltei TaxID=1481888 RepID=A0AAU9J830_9CILI|nr:unnamed protein product [Blepharisma stoltei]
MSRFVLSIVGAGNYGAALAYLASWHSKSIVKLIDTSEEKLSQSSILFEHWFNLDEKLYGPPREDIYDILERITVSPHLEDIEYSDFVVESITENLSQKNEIIQQIEKIVDSDIVIASTTSHISITKIAQNTQFPDRILGLNYTHFPWMSNVCEIVATIKSSNEAIATARNYAKKIGLKPSICFDRPGFIANKSICVIINEAIWILHEGIARKEDIDTSLCGTLCMNVGPLEFADFIGLDEVLDILKTLHRDTGDDKYRPCPLLVNLVSAGMLGRKTSQGFYEYDPNEPLTTYRSESLSKMDKEYNKIINVQREIRRKTEILYEAANLNYLEKFQFEDLREVPFGDLKALADDINMDEIVADNQNKLRKLFDIIEKQKEDIKNKQKENEGLKREAETLSKTQQKVEKAIKDAENKVESMTAELEKMKKNNMYKDIRDPNNPDENLSDWMEKAREVYDIKEISKKEKEMVKEFVWEFTQADSKLESKDFDKMVQEYIEKKQKEREGETAKKKNKIEIPIEEYSDEEEEEEEEDLELQDEGYFESDQARRKKKRKRRRRRTAKKSKEPDEIEEPDELEQEDENQIASEEEEKKEVKEKKKINRQEIKDKKSKEFAKPLNDIEEDIKGGKFRDFAESLKEIEEVIKGHKLKGFQNPFEVPQGESKGRKLKPLRSPFAGLDEEISRLMKASKSSKNKNDEDN